MDTTKVIATDDGLLNKVNTLKILTGIKSVIDNGNAPNVTGYKEDTEGIKKLGFCE